MAIIPILLALFIFLNKSKDSYILDTLKKIDIASIVEILKELNFGGEYLNYLTPELINGVTSGNLDIKSLLPLAIKFFTDKKTEKPTTFTPPPKMDFIDDDIKTALFNYLKV